VIFWTNGSGLQLNSDGEPVLRADEEGKPPFYMEAELNSPLCRLRAGESCHFETEWFPTRAEGDVHGITDAGILVKPLRAIRLENEKITLAGSFGVFFPGGLVVRLYDQQGASVGTVPLADVSPTELVTLQREISADAKATRLSIHLIDTHGVDRGLLGEVPLMPAEKLK